MVFANSQDGGDYKLRLLLDDVKKQTSTEKEQITDEDIQRWEKCRRSKEYRERLNGTKTESWSKTIWEDRRNEKLRRTKERRDQTKKDRQAGGMLYEHRGGTKQHIRSEPGLVRFENEERNETELEETEHVRWENSWDMENKETESTKEDATRGNKKENVNNHTEKLGVPNGRKT